MSARPTPYPHRIPLHVVHDTDRAPPMPDDETMPPSLTELDMFALGITRVDLSTPEAHGAVEALLARG